MFTPLTPNLFVLLKGYRCINCHLNLKFETTRSEIPDTTKMTIGDIIQSILKREEEEVDFLLFILPTWFGKRKRKSEAIRMRPNRFETYYKVHYTGELKTRGEDLSMSNEVSKSHREEGKNKGRGQ